MGEEQDALFSSETGGIQKIFEALASTPRRKILAYLSHSSLTAGEIADRFDMSKPSISQHLSVLEVAGLVRKEKRGQFVHYSIVQESLTNTLNSYVQEVCPVSRPLKKESEALEEGKAKDNLK
jgi:ArsR family transcriptional regulator